MPISYVMNGNDKLLAEIIHKIDPNVELHFGNCKCDGHDRKIIVTYDLKEDGSLYISKIEHPRGGCLGDWERFEIRRK